MALKIIKISTTTVTLYSPAPATHQTPAPTPSLCPYAVPPTSLLDPPEYLSPLTQCECFSKQYLHLEGFPSPRLFLIKPFSCFKSQLKCCFSRPEKIPCYTLFVLSLNHIHRTDQKFTLRVTLLNECLAPHWNISSSKTRAVSLLSSVETPVLRAVPGSWCPPRPRYRHSVEFAQGWVCE